MNADHLTADSHLILNAEGHIQAFFYHGRVSIIFLVADLNLIGTGVSLALVMRGITSNGRVQEILSYHTGTNIAVGTIHGYVVSFAKKCKELCEDIKEYLVSQRYVGEGCCCIVLGFHSSSSLVHPLGKRSNCQPFIMMI